MLTCEIRYKDGTVAGFMVDKGIIVHHDYPHNVGTSLEQYRILREGDKIVILEDDEDAD